MWTLTSTDIITGFLVQEEREITAHTEKTKSITRTTDLVLRQRRKSFRSTD